MEIKNVRLEKLNRLENGEVFKFKDEIYIKANMIGYIDKEKKERIANTILLKSGQPRKIMDDAVVEPLRSAMLVY